jgi:hypothetical protein
MILNRLKKYLFHGIINHYRSMIQYKHNAFQLHTDKTNLKIISNYRS